MIRPRSGRSPPTSNVEPVEPLMVVRSTGTDEDAQIALVVLYGPNWAEAAAIRWQQPAASSLGLATIVSPPSFFLCSRLQRSSAGKRGCAGAGQYSSSVYRF